MNIAASRGFLRLGALTVILAIGATFFPVAWPAVIVVDVCLLIIAVADLFLGRLLLRGLHLELTGNHIWSRGRPEQMIYQLQNRGRMALKQLTCRPDAPQQTTSAEPATDTVTIPGQRILELTFALKAQQRGPMDLGGLHVEARSPLGLWYVARLVPAQKHVAVHPDLKQVNEYTLLARADRLDRIGVRKTRKIGGDNDFERLRDFQRDDPLNRIDWKATARRDRLTVRDYQTSQCQSINLVIDHGRLMNTTITHENGDDRTMLDHAIDAGLMLAHVALLQRDRIGLIAFAEQVTKRLPAHGGGRRFAEMVHCLHDVEPAQTMSRPDDALTYLGKHERKRSLVVIITHIINQTGADLLVQHASALASRHLPLIVLLQDPEIHNLIPAADETFADQEQDRFWLAGATAAVAHERAVALERLKAAGCLVVDTPVADLTPAVVSEYLDIKAKNLL